MSENLSCVLNEVLRMPDPPEGVKALHFARRGALDVRHAMRLQSTINRDSFHGYPPGHLLVVYIQHSNGWTITTLWGKVEGWRAWAMSGTKVMELPMRESIDFHEAGFGDVVFTECDEVI